MVGNLDCFGWLGCFSNGSSSLVGFLFPNDCNSNHFVFIRHKKNKRSTGGLKWVRLVFLVRLFFSNCFGARWLLVTLMLFRATSLFLSNYLQILQLPQPSKPLRQ